MIPTRVFYKKTGRSKYISHLDMSRLVARALKKSGLPVWYTEGFNPHIYTTFALPLSLGYESLCESFDMKLMEQTEPGIIIERLNACLPEGIEVFDAAPPKMKPNVIKWADYRIELYFDNHDSSTVADKIREFLYLEKITTLKKTKKSNVEIDLKPHFQLLDLKTSNESVIIELRMAAGNQLNINPSLLIGAFCDWARIEYDYISTLRTRIITEDMLDFE